MIIKELNKLVTKHDEVLHDLVVALCIILNEYPKEDDRYLLAMNIARRHDLLQAVESVS